MNELAIVILNYNGSNYLRKFLPDVLKYRSGARVIVADNGSTDDSLVILQEHFPEAEVIAWKENMGYSGGYDHVLREINAEYFCLLNSDVAVTEGWLDPALKLFANPTIAAIQPKILSFHSKDHFEYAGAAGGFIDRYGFPFCRGRIFETLESDHGQYDAPTEIFWASGACLFIRAKDFHEAGGLDVDFFAHMEEIDLCWRLQNMGRKVVYEGSSVVYHVGGGTLSKTNPKKTYLNFRNGLSMLYKNTRGNVLAGRMVIRSIFDLLAFIRFLAFFQFAHALAVLKAHVHFWLSFQRQQRKRRKANTHMRISGESEHIFQGSVVWKYFIGGCRKFSKLDFEKPDNHSSS